MAGTDYFSIPIFFIIFRETTEAAVIVSVLLAFLSQVLLDDPSLKKRLARQIWGGTILGLIVSLAIGAAFIVVWNKYANNLWAGAEGIWVGCFSLLAVVMITVMGLAMLRTTQIQEKWKTKLAKAMDNENERGLGNNSRRYALFILPFITVLREGLEAIVFIGGVTFTEQAKAIPIAVIVGLMCGLLVGYILYRGGNSFGLHNFFIASTCLLLLIAAGLVAKGVASFESYAWGKLTNAQSDDGGSYDPRVNVWALTCCDPKNVNSGGWAIFNALFGWMNVASIGTVVSYIMYWLVVIVALVYMKLKRQRIAREKAAEDTLDSPSPDELVLEDKKKHLIVERQNLKEEVDEVEGEDQIEAQAQRDVIDLKKL